MQKTLKLEKKHFALYFLKLKNKYKTSKQSLK